MKKYILFSLLGLVGSVYAKPLTKAQERERTRILTAFDKFDWNEQYKTNDGSIISDIIVESGLIVIDNGSESESKYILQIGSIPKDFDTRCPNNFNYHNRVKQEIVSVSNPKRASHHIFPQMIDFVIQKFAILSFFKHPEKKVAYPQFIMEGSIIYEDGKTETGQFQYTFFTKKLSSNDKVENQSGKEEADSDSDNVEENYEYILFHRYFRINKGAKAGKGSGKFRHKQTRRFVRR